MAVNAAPFLPYGRHVIDEDDIQAVVSVLKGDWLTTGPHVEAFEAELRRVCAVAHAVSCSSATAALLMAVQALALPHGSAIVVPALTFLATASAPHLAGAEIVFADVDRETGLMTADTLAQAIADYAGPSSIRAVIPVHLAGRVCDMVAIRAIAQRHGLAVIEDACHALGGAYSATAVTGNDAAEAKRCVVGACNHSDMAVFSFHPVKTIAAGEGGAVTTNDPALAARLALVRSHGMQRDPKTWVNADLALDAEGKPNPWYYEMHAPALNNRMSDINAALAASQLRKLKQFVDTRARLADCYDALLRHLGPAIRTPARQSQVELGWHLYAPRFDFARLEIDRGRLMGRLKDHEIGSQVHYVPVPWQPYWQARGWRRDAFPGAAFYYDETLSLPLYPGMTEADVQRSVQALKTATGV